MQYDNSKTYFSGLIQFIKDVKAGRYTIVVSHIGFKDVRIAEVLVTSSKPFHLDIQIEEDLSEEKEMTLRKILIRLKTLNKTIKLNNKIIPSEVKVNNIKLLVHLKKTSLKGSPFLKEVNKNKRSVLFE